MFAVAGSVCQLVTLAQPSPALSLGLAITLALALRPARNVAGDAARVLTPAA